jgi:fructose transport system permease protein
MTSLDAAPTTSKPQLPLMKRILGITAVGPLAALILAVLFFALKTDTFWSINNISTVANQVGYLGVLAIGQTLIILTAGIDLSVGLVMAFGAMVVAKTSEQSGLSPFAAAALGILVCTTLGFVNGVLIQKVKLPAFIVTLGMLGIVSMATHVYSKNQTVAIYNDEGLPDDTSPLTWLGRSVHLGQFFATYGTILTLGIFAFFWYVLSKTAFGRHIFAFGDNPEAARLTGIRTARLNIAVYALAGFLYGVGSLIYLARVGAATANDGQTENLETITAVVIGGTSLFGGRGTVIGTLIGALIIGVFRNGFVQMGVDSSYQLGITGALTIIAVAVDQLLKKRR